MELDITNKSIAVYKSLASESRLEILQYLSQGPQTASFLSKKLNMTQSAISKNLQQLLDTQLIRITQSSNNKKEKLVQLAVQSINIQFPESIFPEYHQTSFSIPVGNYFNFANIMPSCGMASDQHVIQRFDDPSVFLAPERIFAQLLWFNSGEIEYQLPINIPVNKNLKLLDFSFEISSEFPGSNNNWPSEIEFWLNEQFVGTFSVTGNFSDVRGKYTPQWWDDYLSQYGELIQLRISERNTGVNGIQISDFTLSNIQLKPQQPLKIKFKIPENSHKQPHGLTLFGEQFGNYHQDILVNSYWA